MPILRAIARRLTASCPPSASSSRAASLISSFVSWRLRCARVIGPVLVCIFFLSLHRDANFFDCFSSSSGAFWYPYRCACHASGFEKFVIHLLLCKEVFSTCEQRWTAQTKPFRDLVVALCG